MVNKQNIIITCMRAVSKSENEFWMKFVEICDSCGYHIYYIGDDALVSNNVTNTYIPRNLDEAYKYLLKYDEKKLIIDNKWINECYYREKEFNKTSSHIGFLSLVKITNMLNELIDKTNPIAIITWTCLTPVSYMIRKIAEIKNIRIFEAERSPLNNYFWIEENNIFEKSNILIKYKPNIKEKYVEKGQQIAEDLIQNVYGFRPPKVRSSRIAVNEYKELINKDHMFFLPMDNIYESGWLPLEHSISHSRYPNHSKPLTFIKELTDKIMTWGHTVLVKPHPSCTYFQDNNYHDIVQYDLKTLIYFSEYVICNHTKVAFPALAMGKTVITFSKNIINYSRSCCNFNSIEEISKDKIQISKTKQYWDKVYNYFGWLAIEHFYSIENDGESIKRLVESFS